jgi:hypothetical protein
VHVSVATGRQGRAARHGSSSSLSRMPLHHLFDVATRYRGQLAVAVADDEPPFKTRGTAYLVDIRSKVLLRHFPVRYERPGYRLALSGDDRLCLLGCCEAYGLAAYATEDGREVWRRKDLKAVQLVAASEVQDWVFCGRESGAAHLLRTATGETLDKLTGIKEVYWSPFDDSVIVVGRSLDLHKPFGTKKASLGRKSGAGVACAFSRSEVAVADGEALRCYDLLTQQPLWAHATIPGKTHFLGLSFNEGLKCFVAAGRDQRVICFEPRHGTILREVKLPSGLGFVFGFCRQGAALLASNLCIYSSETGMLSDDLATPELLAWDPEAKMERLRALAESDRSFEELQRYVEAEGFSKGDAFRVLFWKTEHDGKKET